MADVYCAVDSFVEDRAHEYFLRALLARLARDEGVLVNVRFLSAIGGHPRAIGELRLYQGLIRKSGGVPDLLIVLIDGNCVGWNQARQDVLEVVDFQLFPRVVVGCPDPHIERWYLADPQSLAASLDVHVTPESQKCERDRYKRMLQQAFLSAEYTLVLGGIEFANEIVEAMDLYRAGRNEPSLQHFVDQTRLALRQLPRR